MSLDRYPSFPRSQPMNCPTCSSDQIQRFSAIYEAGTSTIQSKSSGGGVAFTGKGMVPILTGSSSKGVQQTTLAAKASPPSKQSVGGTIAFAVFGVPIVAFVLAFVASFVAHMADVGAESADLITSSIFWIALVGLFLSGIGLATTQHRYNRDEWPAQHAEWERKWFCHKCGTDFVADCPLRAAA